MSGLCENCFKGSKLSGTPSGVWIPASESGASLDAYFASATGNGGNNNAGEGGRAYAKKALIISPDIFGLALDNPKLLADVYATRCEGVDVWVPDTFKGHPPVTAAQLEPYFPDHAGQNLGFMAEFWKLWVISMNIFKMLPYRGSISDPWLVDFVGHLRGKYGYERVAMTGYCWGGGHVARIAALPNVLDVAMPVHPSGSFASAIPNTKVPIAFFLAEEDHAWDDRAGEALKAAWKDKPDAPRLLIKKYPGTAHGFGCRPNLAIPVVKQGWEAFMNDSIAFINENL